MKQKKEDTEKDKNDEKTNYFPPENWVPSPEAVREEARQHEHSEEDLAGFGFCEDEYWGPIGFETYLWRGCWNCNCFVKGKKYPYIDIYGTAKILGVSEVAVRKLVKSGKLRGDRLEQIYTAPPELHIEKRSVEELLKRRRKG